ncbi:MAG: hypothetical protein J3K34DRAFT_448222 [Monoraphidium minutum]|nr:MAG: hypothetical protein J3K34DRAFT_448222 [Monoraphidium minutum]
MTSDLSRDTTPVWIFIISLVYVVVNAPVVLCCYPAGNTISKDGACPSLHLGSCNDTRRWQTQDPTGPWQLPFLNNIPVRSTSKLAHGPSLRGDVTLGEGLYIPCSAQRVLGKAAKLSMPVHIMPHTCNIIVATGLFGGGRDTLRPVSSEAGVCFYAFVDSCTFAELPNTTQSQPGGCMWFSGWCVVTVLKHHFQNPRIASRVFKLLLPQIFPTVRYSVWLDAKLSLKVSPQTLIQNFLSAHNADIAFLSHFARYSVFSEQDVVVAGNMADAALTRVQSTKYIMNGMNESTGLIEGMLILRDHSSFMARLLSCIWWKEYLAFPPRDQTSFNYVAFKLGYRPTVSSLEFQAIAAEKESVRFSLGYYVREEQFQSKVHVAPYCVISTYVTFHGHMKRQGAPCL